MRILKFIILFLVTCNLFLHSPIHAQQDSFAGAQDILNNVLWNYPAQHQISFTLPSDSFPIRNIDYIQIYFPSFTDIQPATLVTGDYSGIPVYSQDGQFVRITGITVLPGGRITIDGIDATNPGSDEEFEVVLMVTEDEAGTILKNYRSIIATLNHADVSVSAIIPNALASLRITGYTSPDTFIIFSESSAVIGTDIPTAAGAFNRLFTGIQAATHRITLYGIDSENRTTSAVPLTIYTPLSQETSVANILLSPTMELNDTDFLSGANIYASGSAIPNGNLTLFVDSPMRTYYATAAADGSWNYTIANTAEYVYGDYRLYALVQNENSLQSLVSNAISFSIIPDSVSGGTACGDITQGDLNCDLTVDLTDFSILMYYWATTDATADMNNDLIVNLTDFSIMMYWWGS